MRLVLRKEELERDGSLDLQILGAIDHAHAARRQRFADTEMRHGAADELKRIG